MADKQNINSKTELEKMGHVIFSTEEGRRFLEELKKIYLINAPVAPHGRDASYAYYREGENNLVRVLLTIGGLLNE